MTETDAPSTTKRRLWLSTIAAIALAACGDDDAAAPLMPPPTSAIRIANFAFSPVTLTVARGSTVTWTNVDAALHTVTSDGTTFDSGSFGQNSTFQFTASQPGTFQYRCAIHPSMRGTLVVQ